MFYENWISNLRATITSLTLGSDIFGRGFFFNFASINNIIDVKSMVGLYDLYEDYRKVYC